MPLTYNTIGFTNIIRHYIVLINFKKSNPRLNLNSLLNTSIVNRKSMKTDATKEYGKFDGI